MPMRWKVFENSIVFRSGKTPIEVTSDFECTTAHCMLEILVLRKFKGTIVWKLSHQVEHRWFQLSNVQWAGQWSENDLDQISTIVSTLVSRLNRQSLLSHQMGARLRWPTNISYEKILVDRHWSWKDRGPRYEKSLGRRYFGLDHVIRVGKLAPSQLY